MSQKKSRLVKKKKKPCPNPRKSKEKKMATRQRYCLGEKKKIKATHVHRRFVNQEKILPYSVFSLFWGENFLVSLGRKGRKHLNSHYLFSFIPTQPNTFQKSFHSYFLSKVFHPLCFAFKQTHPKDIEI